MKTRFIILFFLTAITNQLVAQKLPVVIPEQVGLNTVHLMHIDRVVNEAIENKEIPGAVIAIVKGSQIGYLKAFGNKQTYPINKAMEINTIFDLASCTKPLATGIATMKLVEQGYIRLTDPVHNYLPDFRPYKTDSLERAIRIVDLLTHTSGLPAYAPVSKLLESGEPAPQILKDYIACCDRIHEPSKAMVYSCLNYITLQHIITAVSKLNLDEFCAKEIFEPLNLKDTGFKLSEEQIERTAPTELINNEELLQGRVHDPLARKLNLGISGNAGLFSTAEEVALLTSLFLNQGAIGGKRILSAASIKKISTIPYELIQYGRTPGWDQKSPYSSHQGDLMSDAAFGHTGYTGTSITIDPERDLAIIVLTNSVHPYDKGKTIRLRALISNIVLAADGGASNQGYLKHYKTRMTMFNKEGKISKKDILFIGDSLTENGENWAKRLGNKRIRNRGIVGDNTNGVINRLHSLVEAQPKQVLLTIGINDISQGLNETTLVENIEHILKRFQKESPKTKIYLQSLLPINENKSWYRLMKGKTNIITSVNKRLEALATKLNIEFINSYPLFLEEGGDQLDPIYTNDGLHLNEEGYRVWSDFLKQYI